MPTRPDPILASLYRKVEWAGKELAVPEWVIEKEVEHFKCRELTNDKLRVDMDDGSYEVFSATVVLHCNPYNSHEKPYKGGIRYSESVTPALLRALAFEMTFKCGVIDLEFGGGKAGVELKKPITQYSRKELHLITEAFADVFIRDHEIISPYYYVPATDLGTTSEYMDIIHRKFRILTKGGIQGASVTGRTVGNGGIPGRDEATALGGLIVFEKLRVTDNKMPALPEKPAVIVQGLGQVGGNFCDLASEKGYRIVGVSNVSGAVFNASGIDMSELPRNEKGKIDPNGSLEKVTGEHLPAEEILYKPCDILVLAAKENVVTAANAKRINAKVILELANHPVDEAADKILTGMGIYSIADIFANAGGVGTSFWEWSLSFGSPRHMIQIPETFEEVRGRLTAQMENATEQVLWYRSRYNTDLRGAAWLKSTKRVTDQLIQKHGDRWMPKKSVG